MPPHQNTQRLLDLMSENKLSIGDVALLTGRSIQTVKIWRCSNSQVVPRHLLELLEARTSASKAVAFLDRQLEYLTTTVTATAIREQAIVFSAACRAYREAGVINETTHEGFISCARDFLAEVRVDVPDYREAV